MTTAETDAGGPSSSPSADVVLGSSTGNPLSRVMGVVGVVLASFGAVVLVLHSVAHALLRTFFGSPLTGTIEVVGNWYLPIVVFFGLVVAQRRNEHIEAPLLFGWFGLEHALRPTAATSPSQTICSRTSSGSSRPRLSC